MKKYLIIAILLILCCSGCDYFGGPPKDICTMIENEEWENLASKTVLDNHSKKEPGKSVYNYAQAQLHYHDEQYSMALHYLKSVNSNSLGKFKDDPSKLRQLIDEANKAKQAEYDAVKISERPGLGAERKFFQWAYGKQKNEDNPIAYESVLVTFSKAGRAVFIDIKESKEERIKLIPSDVEWLSDEYRDYSDPSLIQVIHEGYSNSLSEVVPESNGKFMYINAYDRTTRKYFGTVFDCLFN